MEKTEDGFDQQLQVLVRMLGITIPSLKDEATRLLRSALNTNKDSPIADSSFLGRVKKLLFKPTPKRPKVKTEEQSVDVPSPVTPSQKPAFKIPDFFSSSGKYIHQDEDEDDTHANPFVAHPVFQHDIIEYTPAGVYNSRGQRYDEDGDIVRDERVYICEDAISTFSGTPYITDTYDLYALVHHLPLSEVKTAADSILATGMFTPLQDLHPEPAPAPCSTQPALEIESVDPSGPVSSLELIKNSPSRVPAITASARQKRNIVAHYIRTVALPPPPSFDNCSNRVRLKLVKSRERQEKARLRQLKSFLNAIS